MDDNSALRRAKRPASPIAGPYGHPMHPMIVVVPIGAWTSSVVFDLVALIGHHPGEFSHGIIWLIGIGVIGALIAAVFGLMDLSRLASGTTARRTALTHMTINLVVVVLFVISFFVHLAAGYDNASVVGFIISAIGLILVGISGFLGGRMAYRFGVRVADEDTQREAYR